MKRNKLKWHCVAYAVGSLMKKKYILNLQNIFKDIFKNI